MECVARKFSSICRPSPVFLLPCCAAAGTKVVFRFTNNVPRVIYIPSVAVQLTKAIRSLEKEATLSAALKEEVDKLRSWKDSKADEIEDLMEKVSFSSRMSPCSLRASFHVDRWVSAACRYGEKVPREYQRIPPSHRAP